jgi:hypothetical protein
MTGTNRVISLSYAVTYEIAGLAKSDTGKKRAITRERNEKQSRIKQKLHIIFIKESSTMQIVRIYVQNDARCHFFIF